MNAAFDTDVLADLATRRHECLRQLHALGVRQLELIDVEDMTTLLGVLAASSACWVRCRNWSAAWIRSASRIPNSGARRHSAGSPACAELISQSQALFAEIIAHEKEGETRMQTHRDQAAARLQGANAGAQRKRLRR